MTRKNISFIDPTTISLPSPPSETPESSTSALPSIDSPSSSSSSSAKSRPHPTSDGPPRKRSRTELTSEERKEARAHRNRIAAQNSRDRRKAQFVALEDRIAELETENRTLRSSMGIAALRESEDQKAAERARERENQELRERIRVLESGWDAIVKALQTHGLPPGIPSAVGLPQLQTPTSHSNELRSPSMAPSSAPSSTSTTTSFPVLIPPSPVFPLSPSPSQSSVTSMFEEYEPTRHLAAGELATHTHDSFDASGLDFSLDHFGELAAPSSPVDEAAMDDLFREILAPSPTLSSSALPGAELAVAPAAAVGVPMWTGETVEDRERERNAEAEAEREMQRLLDMLPTVNGDGMSMNVDGLGIPSTLDLDIGAWDFGVNAPVSVSSQVF